MGLDYFYGAQAEQYSFIRIPKAMMSDSLFTHLSGEAKLLYGLLLDSMSMSTKNRWIDDRNRVFVIYPITRIMEDLNVSKGKAIDTLAELENVGLIDKRSMGQGKPSFIYVKNFLVNA